jgi:G3E family GTPase
MTSAKARYIMIGGFLGAGKTTAVAALARSLTDRGLRVGLITNDQSTQLVDSAVLRAHGFAVEEIAGGCFCCRFDSLNDAARRLTDQTRPDVFIAEPVGSCTDLVATVSYPLRRIYGHDFSIAPLSVMVDPVRAARILGLAEGRSFSPKVVYVYEKQLEEADIIVINKIDVFADADREPLERELRARFPRARVLACSARHGDGLERWFEEIRDAECDVSPTMALDYDRYAEGEALLGWLNCSVHVEAAAVVDGNALLMELTKEISARLEAHSAEIAHLKLTLDSEDHGQGLAVVSLVRGGEVPDLRESLLGSVKVGTLILNLRAEADPSRLRDATEAALEDTSRRHSGLSLTITHLEHFRPGRPEPTHRMAVAG